MHQIFQPFWAGRSTPEYGNVFTETGFTSTSDFPIEGSAITRGTNKITGTGNPTLFKAYIFYDSSTSPFRYTCLEHWKQRVRVKSPTAINGTSFGLGIGVKSVSGWASNKYSTYVRWAWDSSANSGKIYLYNVSATTNQIISGTALAPVANTYYWLDVERVKNEVTTTIYSDSSGSIGSQLFTVTQSFSLASGFVQAHNTGQFAIHHFGGTSTEVTHWEVSTKAKKNLDYLVIGDSNTYGLFATANNLRWAELAMASKNRSYNICAAISERTTEVLQRLNEVKALKPINVLISLGRNDLASGTALSTVTGNCNTIISTLEAAGITVKLGGVIASNTNVSGLQTYYTSRSNQQVNFYTDSKSAGTSLKSSYNNGDGIHMNTTGNTGIATLAATIL